MTYAISEKFSDQKTGLFSIWDTTVDHESDKAWLAANQHVDLRNFRSLLLTRPVLEEELEAELESTLESVTEQFLETVTTATGQSWVLTGTGLGAITVGPVAAKNNWGALQATTNGSALSATLVSSGTIPIDISAMTYLSVIFPDYNTFDGTSYIQLCSNTAGDFTTNNSAQVLFSANGSSMPEMRLNVSSFANSGFSINRVTGVKIVLTKTTIAGGQTLTIMGMRARNSGWSYRQMDFDTILGALVMPVTLSGGAPAGGTGVLPLIRGLGDKNDPIPQDLALNLYFCTGGHGGFLATGSNYNKVEMLWRELNDIVAGTGSHITTRLRWNASGTFFDALRFDYAASTLTPTATYTESLSALTPETLYLFRVELQGTTIVPSLYQVDANGLIINTIWKSPGTSSTNYTFRNGRVGLSYDFQYDRDAFLSDFEAGVTNYAQLETTFYNQRSVIDGAQLAASFSADMNLWQSFTASDIFLDPTKTVSGMGSYRSTTGLSTNQFEVEDWNNTYLNFALWVPLGVNASNTPVVQMVSTAGQVRAVFLPMLQPAQWNTILADLTVMNDLLTGVGYTLQIIPATNPTSPLGPFWVDSMMIGRRRVAWAIRAQANAPYRDFRGLVNSRSGAVHFIHAERGTQLELRATALTSDAWCAVYNLFPHKAELGAPIYDASYETR